MDKPGVLKSSGAIPKRIVVRKNGATIFDGKSKVRVVGPTSEKRQPR